MDIIYRKDTLYVYLRNEKKLELAKFERKIKKIMERYEIDKLVIDTGGQKIESIHDLECRFCFKNKAKVLVR